MLFLCLIHREIASGEIHDSKQMDIKKSGHPPNCIKFYTLTPKIS
jgi:hypothetical protein